MSSSEATLGGERIESLPRSWTLQGKLWTGGGGRKEPGECGLAGKIQFLREETGSESGRLAEWLLKTRKDI
ncbi:hypothetical protein EYF80_006421 [Liparis tanakae]|uniref:Uncharacterized protein n=1 Tax=Liparis tanakae TaxID=230148 RepID=A0A4Z2IZL5_9TELE|nr:hypothetical protein EYF80_006421 [Liparis tanakae]